MDVTPSTTTSISAANAPANSSAARITSDFDTFLRMLTVQMQNQDPLNPIDSADYAVQLATFSGVEQQVRTNQLLAEMQGRFQQLGLAEMSSWIGKEARTSAAVLYDGAPVTLSASPTAGATRSVLVVTDASGNLVSREEVPVSAAPYSWLGSGADGEPLPPGLYSIALESLNGETVLSTGPVEHYAPVLEARATSAGTTLVLAGGVEVPAESVTALRGSAS